jgi:ABC-type transport system involved in multi-copper enzyme maturation permease subunit
MMAASPLATMRQLCKDTFRQACASGIFWMMLAVTAIGVLLCLSVSVSGDTRIYGEDEPGLFLPPPSPRAVVPSMVAVLAGSAQLDTLTLIAVAAKKVWLTIEYNPALARKEGIERSGGRMALAFGAVSFSIGRERADSVRFLELLLAGGIAGTLGVLLALVWTAGFVPAFLDPSSASVLLAKPAARWQLLLGKYFGVLIFVGFQVVLFVVLTWLALGVRTSVWDATYLVCIPLLLLQFAVFYSFSLLLGVVTRSTVACIFGSLLFWLLSWGMNYGKVMILAMPESQKLPGSTQALAEAAYWIAPKPIDAGLIMFNALDAQHHFQKPETFQVLESSGKFSPQLSIISSLVITCLLLGISVYEFRTLDY